MRPSKSACRCDSVEPMRPDDSGITGLMDGECVEEALDQMTVRDRLASARWRLKARATCGSRPETDNSAPRLDRTTGVGYESAGRVMNGNHDPSAKHPLPASSAMTKPRPSLIGRLVCRRSEPTCSELHCPRARAAELLCVHARIVRNFLRHSDERAMRLLTAMLHIQRGPQ